MTAVRHDDRKPGPRVHAGLLAQGFAVFAASVFSQEAQAQDAGRGARLYLQLPTAASCVSCHGPDPSQGRNNLLRAADQPLALQKALSTIGAMGYLKPLLEEADVADLAAYLGAVQRAATVESPVALWPVTIEFGGVALAGASPVQTVVLRNVQATALPLAVPRVDGPAAAGVLLATDCAQSLAPAAECHVQLRAQPTATGPAAGALVLASGTALPWIVGLSFTARADPVGVLSTDLAQASLDFGSAAVGEALQRSFRLVNHGTAPATFGVMTLTGPGRTAFRIADATSGPEVACTAGQALAPGSGCTMRIGFAAGIAGSFRAMLQWRGDATQPADLELIGTVAPSPSPAPPVAPPAPPTSPPADAPAGGGCSAGPPVRRVDPVMPLTVLAVLGCLWARRRAISGRA